MRWVWLVLAGAACAPKYPDDWDGDGWAGEAAGGDDCDDTDPTVHPGAEETCDGVDQDCDGEVDEDAADAATFYADADGDGWGDPEAATEACEAPAGHVAADRAGDCDDGDPAVHPEAEETCDGVDEDCDGEVDDDPVDPATFYADADGDGWGDPEAATEACEALSGTVAAAGDCDDGDPAVHPEAEETPYDGIDQDCDGADLTDVDGDGWDGAVAGGEDCDDGDPEVHPGAFDWAGDAVDQDCDGLEDGIALDPDAALTGGEGDHLGASLDAGDFDGDGSLDVIVGADAADVSGPASGTAWIVPLGASGLASASGVRLGGAGAGDSAGFAVRALPDVAGDGFDEAVVAAPLATVDGAAVGAAGVFFGPVTGTPTLDDADVLLLGESDGDFFGASLGTGDFDGDGRGDLVVGATDVGILGTESGRVYVYLDVAGAVSRDDADFVVSGGTAGGNLGQAAASGLDLNGDGLDDLVVSAARRTGDAGVVTVFFGPLTTATCLGSCTTGDGDLRVISGDAQASRFGAALAAAGDLDGDGLDDLVIGDPGYTTVSGDEGAVFGFAGTTASSELAVTADLLLLGEEPGDQAGAALAGGVDVDGDGWDDLLVGGPSGGDDAREGRAWLVGGPLSGTLLLTLADAVWVGDAAGDRAGYAVGLFPDADGDGRAEVVLSAPGTGDDPGSLFFATGP